MPSTTRTSSRAPNIDGNPDVKWDSTEIDQHEYVRFVYSSAATMSQRIHVGDPADRMTDGIFIGPARRARSGRGHPVTHFQITVDFYDNVDWGWVSSRRSPASGTFNAAIDVPGARLYGMYEGDRGR